MPAISRACGSRRGFGLVHFLGLHGAQGDHAALPPAEDGAASHWIQMGNGTGSLWPATHDLALNQWSLGMNCQNCDVRMTPRDAFPSRRDGPRDALKLR